MTTEPKAPEAIKIDVTPTWSAVLPLLLAGMEHGTNEARDAAKIELRRMAAAADKWNAHARKDTLS